MTDGERSALAPRSFSDVDASGQSDDHAAYLAAPICEVAPPCDPVGIAIVGIDARSVATRVAAAAGDVARSPETVAIYDLAGNLLTLTSDDSPPPARRVGAGDIEQRQMDLGGQRRAVAYAEFTIAGQPGGVVATAIPVSNAFSSASGPALRLVACSDSSWRPRSGSAWLSRA